jgi:hypothetical protein
VRVVQTGLSDTDEAIGFTNLGWTGYFGRLTRLLSGADVGPDPFTGR